MKGLTSDVPLAEVLRDLHFDRKDGVLHVTGGGRNDELYLDQGEVFYCKTDAPGERLDQILVKWGLVPSHEVAALVQRAGQDVRGALVREGIFADENGFDDFMNQVLRERMAQVFTRSDANWEYEERDVRALRAVAFDTKTPDVILEGVRRMAHAETVLAALIEDDSALRLNSRPAVPVESLRMGPSEGYVLSMVDGSTPVSAIARTSPLGEGDTLRLLYALLVLDVLTHPSYEGYRFAVGNLAQRRQHEGNRDAEQGTAIDTEYARVRGLDVFHLLPGLPDGSLDERRARIKAWLEEWKPERFSERTQKEMREQLAYLAGRGGEALLGLMEAEHRGAGGPEKETEGPGADVRRLELTKSESQERLDALERQAMQYLAHAEEAVSKKDYHSAVQYLREGIRLHDSSEAQEMLGDALAENPHWRRKAEEAYQRAMELDRFKPHLPVKLGNLYAHAGMTAKARAAYERALDIQSDYEDAKQAIRDLRRQR
jgi:tetratricopeptide (TPR) repeat protein